MLTPQSRNKTGGSIAQVSMSNTDAHDGLHEFQHTGFDLVINGRRVCTTEQVVKDGIVSVFYSLKDAVQSVKKGYKHGG